MCKTKSEDKTILKVCEWSKHTHKCDVVCIFTLREGRYASYI